EALLNNRMRYISSDVNPMIQQWMCGMAVRQLHEVTPNIRVADQQVYHYIIRHNREMDASPTRSQSSESSFMSAESEGTADTATAAVERMDVDSESDKRPGSESEREPEVERDVPDSELPIRRGPLRIPDPRPHAPRINGATPRERGVENDDWQSQVPSDWVPIITRDIATQRRQPPQQPFSDTYLSGMPAKRRKLMEEKKCTEELGKVTNIVPVAIENAASAVGATAISSTSDMVKDCEENTALSDSYQEQVQATIRHRLRTDPNYRPEKFPNTKKYFDK
ncbi:unnamed protein product, partial [Owenia fusiformis]